VSGEKLLLFLKSRKRHHALLKAVAAAPAAFAFGAHFRVRDSLPFSLCERKNHKALIFIS
jgi:hypothetical protein